MLALRIHFFREMGFDLVFLRNKKLFNNHFDRCSNASVSNSITLWFQFIVTSLFHCILSLEVYDIGTLLRLFMTMATDLHQGVDHPFKRINLIIPYNEIARFFHAGKNIGFFPLLSARIISNGRHGANLRIKISGC